MSLQKKLLQAGLMSKKQDREISQQAKKERKSEKGNRKKKKQLLREEKAAQAAEQEQRLQERIAVRQQSESQQMARARALQIQQLIGHHHISYRSGTEAYWHYAVGRQFLHKLLLPPSLVHSLQEGKLAIVVKGALDDFNTQYVLIPSEIADRIRQHEPQRVLDPD